jgi:hypothetical protein
MFEYFYHEILRKTVIGFGSLFNNVNIKHRDGNDNTVSVMKVPLAYGPTQKFLARLEQSPDLNKPVQLTLPRMSFEFNGLSYDPQRKTTATKTFTVSNSASPATQKKVYMPVPYNMRFELSILSKTNEDALQIIEQILPYFQPSYNLTINLVEGINEKKDVPIQLEGISMSDDYEGDYSTRRALVYTLTFTAKTHLFGPVQDSKIIKKATVDVMTGMETPKREMRYTVTPRATKDYNNDIATVLAEDISVDEKYINVDNASGISAKTYIYVNNEEMYVSAISGNKLTVRRGEDNTTATTHVRGSAVKLITTTDDNLIEIGDDFGFNETVSFFQDFKEFSPTLNQDIEP